MKILIADSGSTKTLWTLVDTAKGQPTLVQPCMTGGLNPLYTSEEVISDTAEVVVQSLGERHPDLLTFYGSGCSGNRIQTVERGLRRVFPPVTRIEVHSDLLGTCRALYDEKRGGELICCIMGTGSICAFYDGETPRSVSALGYILGDEGSGAWLGRQVLADYLKDQMPSKVKAAFEADYGVITAEYAIDRTYRQLFPNRYLASFAAFVGRHLEEHSYCQRLAFEGVEMFWKRNVLRLSHESKCRQIAFVGTVAYHLQTIIRQVAALYDYEVVNVLQNPMDGLIDYAARKVRGL